MSNEIRSFYVPENKGIGERLLDLNSRLLKERIVFLNGVIETESIDIIVKQITFLNAEDSRKPIYLHITSPGGEVYSALKLVDFMSTISCPIFVRASGLIASAATIISAFGKRGERKVFPNSRIMIHQPSGGTSGQMTDMEINLREGLLMKRLLADMMADRCYKASSNQSTEEFKEKLIRLMERDHYMSAQAAVELGLFDEIIPVTSEYRTFAH